jgi:hypothetical protein
MSVDGLDPRPVDVDAGVVDHSIHGSERVDLVGDRPDLVAGGEIADDEVGEVASTLLVAGMTTTSLPASSSSTAVARPSPVDDPVTSTRDIGRDWLAVVSGGVGRLVDPAGEAIERELGRGAGWGGVDDHGLGDVAGEIG